jgi:hypothetical protein
MKPLDILSNIDNPRQLETLYRNNKGAFKSEFNMLYPELHDRKIADYWHERLNYETEISWGSNTELILVILLSGVAGILAKFPAMLNIKEEFFYPRNLGFIVFPALTAYFAWKNSLTIKKIIPACIVFLIAALFINLFPGDYKSDTLVLSCIHLPIFLWAVLGFTFAGDEIMRHEKRIDFLRFNGDLAIMSGLILVAGGLLTAITVGLFSIIGLDIRQFYIENIVFFGLPAVPVFATYIIQTNPQLVNKISPVIAKIFSPLVLITLIIYLGAILYSGKDPYNDRDFLMVFNMLLIGVMALIFFSVSESSKKENNRLDSIILLALSMVTVIVNGIALSAILFRISEWGITPNRLAIMGANILMLSNLLAITFRLFKSVAKKGSLGEVENSISMFLPVYILWTIIVAFIFPVLFRFT